MPDSRRTGGLPSPALTTCSRCPPTSISRPGAASNPDAPLVEADPQVRLCRSVAGRARRALNQLDVELDEDLVGHAEAAVVHDLVILHAEILAVDLAARRGPDLRRAARGDRTRWRRQLERDRLRGA